MKKNIFYIFFFIVTELLSQNYTEYSDLKTHIKELCNKENQTFHKAHVFFFKKEMDSCFIYSSKTLAELKAPSKIKNYANYIHGYSAFEKGFFTTAQQAFKSIDSTFKHKHFVDYSLGALALKNKEYRKSIDYYSSVLNSKKIQSNNKLKKIYHNIGTCYLHLKQYTEAEAYLTKELKLSEKEKDTLSIIYAKMDLGNLFYVQYKDEQAISYFEAAYNLGHLFSDFKSKELTSKNMAIVEKNRKNYKKSVNYLIEASKWKDSLWNRDQISKLLKKDKQIAMAKKDKEIFIQEEIAKKQKNRFLFSLITSIVILFFLGILFYFYRVKTAQNKLINEQKATLEKLNATKNYLFSVISHDLRSPVNALSNQYQTLSNHIKKGDLAHSEKTLNDTITLIEGIQHLLNNVLHWSLEQSNQLFFSKKTIRLQPTIQHVLFDFKSIAKVKQIDLQADLDNTIFVNIDMESLKIVLRNSIDNAIKYTPKKGQITIRTKLLSENQCCIEIEDNGKGMTHEQLEEISNLKDLSIDKIDRSKGIGLGLLLCNTLIKRNDGLLAIESELSQGTTFKIILPLITNV